MRIHSYVLGALFLIHGASTTDATNDHNVQFVGTTVRTQRDDFYTGNNVTHKQTRNATNSTSHKSLLNWQINRDDAPLQISDDNVDSIVKKRDVDEAVAEGLRRMHQLYFVKEPQLYEMGKVTQDADQWKVSQLVVGQFVIGLFLDDDEPAGRVASFNKPNPRAIHQSRYGYAAVQALLQIKQNYLEIRSRRNPELVSFLRTDAFDDQCPLRGIPRCPPAAQRYRTADGTCNNIEFPWKGASMLPMQRFLLPAYDDDVQSIRRAVRNGGRLPSPREVSIRIHRDRDIEMASVTMMFVQWGQFVDHDITSTAQSRAFNASIPRCCARGGGSFLPPEFTHPECLPIAVPEDDWFLGRLGIRCIEFVRSAPSARINCDLGWREQINQVTSYIDASTVYGSDPDRADSLRIFRNGLLQYGRSRRAAQVPPDPPGAELCRMGALSTQCFKGGDARVGEQPGLTAFHTIWLRYHNRIAAVIGNLNSHWSDEKVYQEARRIIGALIQHITYKEFLPIVLGHEVMALFDLNVERKGFYNGYDALVNPTPANSFSSAAFRFGHSLVQHSFMRSDAKHRLLVNNVTIHEELDNPENIWTFGSIDRLILGFCNQPSQRRDEFISRELTNHLFQQPGQPFGSDLAAINIQRGRDHGIPAYTAWREPCGLSPIRTWSDLEAIMNFETIQRLRSLYEHVDDIDLYPGGLAERPVRGGIVGPTFACIIAQQFSNLRKGDRFWYENGGFESSFTPAQLQQIRRVTFAPVLCQVLPEIESIQPFVFLSPDNFRNTRLSCDSRDMDTIDLRPWEERRVSAHQPLEKPVQPQFLPLGQSQSVGSAPIQPEGSASRSIPINVNDHLDEFGGNIEFMNAENSRPQRLQTHLIPKIDSEPVQIMGIEMNDHPKTSPTPLKLLQQQILIEESTISITTPNPQKETTRKLNISEVVHLTVPFRIRDAEKHISTESKPVKVVKRSTPKPEANPLNYAFYEEDYGIENSTDVTTGHPYGSGEDSRKHSANTKRGNHQKKRPTTKRPPVLYQNRPLTSDFDNPFKITVANVTTSTIDLGPDHYTGLSNVSLKPQLQPTFTDRTRPTVYYQTTRQPLTYDQDQYYVLHPTIEKPNRYRVPANHGSPSTGFVHVPSENSKTPNYQVNINIHLISSTPGADILINNKLVSPNPNVHIVDGAYVNYEQWKQPANNFYQYTEKKPLTITSTKRPDDFRPRPSISSSTSLYHKPTSYSDDRFEDHPFSTSKRPQIYRPSQSLLSMFEKMHSNPNKQSTQSGTKRPTHVPSFIDKVTRPLHFPSYLYYNDGKYFEHPSQTTPIPPSSDLLYVPQKVSNANTNMNYNSHKDQQNFVKISSVLGSQYVSQSSKEQFIHTAQQKSDEVEMMDNATKLSVSKFEDILKQYSRLHQNASSSNPNDMTDFRLIRTTDDADIDRDIETIDSQDEEIDKEKIQIDVIPQESRQDDWVLYEPIEESPVMDEPEIEQSYEHLAQELPKPLSEFWKIADNDSKRRT